MMSSRNESVKEQDEESSLFENKVQPFSPTLNVGQFRDEEKKNNHSSLSEILGLEEFFALKVWRASIGELVGMAVFVFTIDIIVISSYETKTKTPNLMMSCLISITISILLLATNPVSGGHLNPVITLAATFVGLISLSRAFIYILAQCVGAIIGALALKAVISSTMEEAFSLGGCTLTVIAPGPHGPITVGIETGQAFWLETICTFVLLFGSIWMAFDHRQARNLGRVMIFLIVGVVVGLLVFVSTTVTATKGYAGAGMNPARCLGPAVVRGGHLWKGHWVFWAGPAIACVAFYVYIKLIPSDHFHAEGYKHDFSNVFRTSLKLHRTDQE